MNKQIATLEELEVEAKHFVSTLRALPTTATLVTLSGELGAGKTAFTKAVAKLFGVEEVVTSPTFVLEKIYELTNNSQGFTKLVHIDAYRLKDGSELHALGFDEIMKESRNLVFLEWPEQVSDGLPTPAVRISITTKDNVRTLSYE